MPLEGMNRKDYLKTKFGSEEKAQEIYKKIYQVGVVNKLYFQFDKIKKTPNSFASHKLLALAFLEKKQETVLQTLFYSYFIEGINIGDLNELIKIAKQHNIYDKNTLNYLSSDEDKENLLGEQIQAQNLGINSVPCFIVDKKIVLFGAQDKKAFYDLFKTIT